MVQRTKERAFGGSLTFTLWGLMSKMDADAIPVHFEGYVPPVVFPQRLTWSFPFRTVLLHAKAHNRRYGVLARYWLSPHPFRQNREVMKTCAYCGGSNADGAIVCSQCGTELSSLPIAAGDSQLEDPTLSLATIGTFLSVAEAGPLVSSLEAAGIEVCTPEEYQPFGGIASESVTVRVAAKDYEAARAIAAEMTKTEQTAIPPRISEWPKDAASATPNRVQASDPVDRKACVACGATIPSSATLCPKCGYTQPPIA